LSENGRSGLNNNNIYSIQNFHFPTKNNGGIDF
jgi:hypothetical protein